MKKTLEKITIKNRIIILIVATGVILTALTGVVTAWRVQKELFNEKTQQLQFLTESALNVAKMYDNMSEKGLISLKEAKKRAASAVNNMNYDGENYIWINDKDGVTKAHIKKELIGSDMFTLKDSKGKRIIKELTEKVVNKGFGEQKYLWSKPGEAENKLFEKLSYGVYYDKWGWMFATGIYIDDIQHVIASTMTSILTVVFTITVLIILVGYLTVGRSIVEPIQHLTALSLRLADNDLTIDIEEDNNETEIGDLNRSFKRFVLNLKGLISTVSSSVEEVSSSSEEMSASSEQAAEGTQQVASSIQQLAAGAQEQANNVTDSLTNINEMNSVVQKISINLDATVELSKSTEEDAKEGREQAGNAVYKINQIKETSNNVATTINELGTLSTEIEQIVDLIKGIAGQTNLLALNAAIEAARAGEHGKGFAVVADEVKKLAGESAAATDKITEMIKEIQDKTTTAVSTMNESVSEVEEGVSIVESTGVALEKILEAAQGAGEQVHEISNEVNHLAQSSDNVVKMMESISSITEESAASTEEISSISEEQTAAAQQISASSHALAKLAEDLQKQIAVFKV